jgi:hypothetical protein
MPWPKSHEIFYGHKGDLSSSSFIDGAAGPLIDGGRLPVFITGLDPSMESEGVREIFESQPSISAQTMFVRLQLKSRASIAAAANLLVSLVEQARMQRQLPRFWPLFQGDLSVSDWQRFVSECGSNWQYAAVAVNPFVSTDVLALLKDQIAVAQIPIGAAEGVNQDGRIVLPGDMNILGTSGKEAEYYLSTFVRNLAIIDNSPPVLIVLGPALQGWTHEESCQRLERFNPLLRLACRNLWGHLTPARVTEILDTVD